MAKKKTLPSGWFTRAETDSSAVIPGVTDLPDTPAAAPPPVAAPPPPVAAAPVVPQPVLPVVVPPPVPAPVAAVLPAAPAASPPVPPRPRPPKPAPATFFQIAPDPAGYRVIGLQPTGTLVTMEGLSKDDLRRLRTAIDGVVGLAGHETDPA